MGRGAPATEGLSGELMQLNPNNPLPLFGIFLSSIFFKVQPLKFLSPSLGTGIQNFSKYCNTSRFSLFTSFLQFSISVQFFTSSSQPVQECPL